MCLRQRRGFHRRRANSAAYGFNHNTPGLFPFNGRCFGYCVSHVSDCTGRRQLSKAKFFRHATRLQYGLQCGAVATLRFACQPGCTRCCEVKGYVYLTEDDIVRAAEFLNMTPGAFEAKYVIRYRHLLRFRKPRGAQCHFLRDGGCGIHPVKPVQCRLYPFWPELVENHPAWIREKRECPGIGKGDLVQIGTACEIASEMKRAYPSMYPQPEPSK